MQTSLSPRKTLSTTTAPNQPRMAKRSQFESRRNVRIAQSPEIGCATTWQFHYVDKHAVVSMSNQFPLSDIELRIAPNCNRVEWFR